MGRSNPNKPVSVKEMYRMELRGKRVLSSYTNEATAKRRASQLRKQGYAVKVERIMGSSLVWVSRRYFKDHPKAKPLYA